MRILWVKVGGLWPLTTGGRLRSFHLVNELSARHEVSLLTTHDEAPSPALRDALPRCASVESLPHRLPRRGSARFALSLVRSWSSSMPVDVWKCRAGPLREAVEARLRSGGVDLCVVDFLAAAPNVPFSGTNVPTVLFSHNVEHRIWQRLRDHEPRRWRRALLDLEWRKMRRYEARTCLQAALTVTVSDADASTLAALAPAARFATIPTGVDTQFFTPDQARERPHHLVFTGAMDWYPNEDGARHFLTRTWPRIRRAVPDASLSLVGRSPSARLAAEAAAAGAVVTGTVDDVRPHVLEGAVSVVPLRIGGGTRLKIFEALAMGKAIVSTTVGAEGLPLEPGYHYDCADEPEAFADAVIGLLRDPQRRAALGRAGRVLVDTHYSWPQVARTFERRLLEAMVTHAS